MQTMNNIGKNIGARIWDLKQDLSIAGKQANKSFRVCLSCEV